MSETGKIPQLSEKDLFTKLHDKRKKLADSLDDSAARHLKEIVAGIYSEQAHFVYELLQNADDAKATKARFVLTKSGLIFAHNGTVRFTLSDADTEDPDKEKGKLGHINAITSFGQSSKNESEIGKFGIGFKSVFQYTESPEIFDPPLFFRLDRNIVPVRCPTDHKERNSDETLFYFPFNSQKTSPDDAYKEIITKLKNLKHPLLFLKNLERIDWNNEELQRNYSKVEKPLSNNGLPKIVSMIKTEDQTIVTKFLVFENEISHPKNPQKTLKINIAFKILEEGKRLDSTEKYSPFCFFETQDQADLRFIIQAPFTITNNRALLKENDLGNEYLIEKIASLLGENLPTIRDLGYLSMDFFEILPLPSKDYLEPILKGKNKLLFDVVLEKMKSEEKLLPTNNGGHTNLKSAIIARGGKDFIDLFRNKQLEDLEQLKEVPEFYGKTNLQWLDSRIYDKYLNDKKIWPFFTDVKYLGITVCRPDGPPKLITKKFLETQDDPWMIQLYSFLLDKKDSSDKLKETPYIRISVPKAEINKRGEIDHVKPSDAVLPIEDNKQLNELFPIVKTKIVDDNQAKQFLEKIGLAPPNEYMVLSQFLPKLIEQTSTDDKHKDLMVWIVNTFQKEIKDNYNKEKLVKLQEQLRDIPFLYATNCDGKRELKSPQTIYLSRQYSGNDDLEQFFEKNPNIWFLDSMYASIPNFDDLKKFLEISTKPKISTPKFPVCSPEPVTKKQHRDGFTQDYIMDGLKFFFANQTMTLKTSLYLWKLLLESQKDPQPTIEFSGYLKYAKYDKEKNCGYIGKYAGTIPKTTEIFDLLTQYAWIPNKQSEFECPSKVKEFHDDFDQISKKYPDESEKLFKALKFSSDSLNWMEQVKSKIPETEFNKFKLASETPEEFIIEAHRKYQETQKQTETTSEQSAKHIDSKKEFLKNLNRPQRSVPTDIPVGDDTVSNPERRRENTKEEIQHSHENEPPLSDRISFSLVKKWDGKKLDTRIFLLHEYRGECQICSYSFKKWWDGEPYFEGMHIIPYTKGVWLDRPGSVLCLCPTCCAKMLHGSVSVGEDIIQQILDHKLKKEGGIGKFEIPIILCGEEKKLRFTEKHILDLQEILKFMD